MSEQISDELHSDAACEQVQREGMAEAVCVVAGEPELRLPQTLLEDIADCRPKQWPLWAARPQEKLRTSALSIPRDCKILAQYPRRRRRERQGQSRPCLVLRYAQGAAFPAIESSVSDTTSEGRSP